MDKVFKVIGVTVVAIIIVFIFSVLISFPVMWLWNWLMPVIFKLPLITIWQSLGLSLLSGLLLKSNNMKNK